MRLAADANVLLSAVIGGRSRLVLGSARVDQVFTTKAVILEVEEYAPVLARKKGLPKERLLLTTAELPVKVVPSEVYRSKLQEAHKRMHERDPEDAELVALALHLRIPVWSNDTDFAAARVPWFTTDALFRHLGI